MEDYQTQIQVRFESVTIVIVKKKLHLLYVEGVFNFHVVSFLEILYVY